MILKRETYLEKIRPFYDVDLIKVITGVRRAGKSILLESIMNELIEKGIKRDNIIYFNLEDLDYSFIENANDLHIAIKEKIKGKRKYYIFLDEIQHVEHFEKALASFRATLNCSIFVTGSNSTLLSGELATLLTGRTVEFEVLPFSFLEMKEYYEANDKPFDEDMIYDYIKWGGFPIRYEFNDDLSKHKYLENLYHSIINRDIVTKKSKINKNMFMIVSLYMLANAGKEFSAKNIVSYVKSNNQIDISEKTIYNFIEKMKAAFLIHGVRRYNISGKEALKNKEKYYSVDNGFRVINTNTIDYSNSFFLENIVYNELIFQGFLVYVGKTYKSEIDFIAIKGEKKCFIQVSYLLASQETIEREFGAFKPISDASPKYVISLDKLDMSRNGIVHLNLIDFLLHKRELLLT